MQGAETKHGVTFGAKTKCHYRESLVSDDSEDKTYLSNPSSDKKATFSRCCSTKANHNKCIYYTDPRKYGKSEYDDAITGP